jgi:hypothetical protein
MGDRPPGGLALNSKTGRIVSVATVAASLDASVVNVALPHIGLDLDVDLGMLQWVLTGYLLALASCFSWGVHWATGTGDARCSLPVRCGSPQHRCSSARYIWIRRDPTRLSS